MSVDLIDEKGVTCHPAIEKKRGRKGKDKVQETKRKMQGGMLRGCCGSEFDLLYVFVIPSLMHRLEICKLLLLPALTPNNVSESFNMGSCLSWTTASIQLSRLAERPSLIGRHQSGNYLLGEKELSVAAVEASLNGTSEIQSSQDRFFDECIEAWEKFMEARRLGETRAYFKGGDCNLDGPYWT